MAGQSVSALEQFERLHVSPNPGRTLIVGSKVYGGKEDRRHRYANAVGIDMLEGEGVDHVLDLEEPLPDWIGKFDHVECMSVLEHSRRPWLMAENIERLMKPGASLFVSAPFVWRVHAYPNDYWRYTPEGIAALFPNIEWSALMMASNILSAKPKLSAVHLSGHPYMPRAEVAGFGHRR